MTDKFRSEFEEKIGKRLKGEGVPYEYEKDKFTYLLKKNYLTDFSCNGIFLEVKGYFKPSDRTKMRAVKEMNPDLDIRFVFMRDNYLTKSKKGRYSDWAKKYGFPYCVKHIPPEWIEEMKANNPEPRLEANSESEED